MKEKKEFYGMPEDLKAEARRRLPDDLRGILHAFEARVW